MWSKKNYSDLRLASSKKSLTKYLSQFGDLEIQLISSNIQKISEYEKKIYGGVSKNFYVRDVVIGFKKKPLIFARSITESHNSKRLIYLLKKLNNRSLGSILFSRNYIRSQFKYSKSKQIQFSTERFRKKNVELEKLLVLRQSFFTNRKEKILLFEGFLENAKMYDE